MNLKIRAGQCLLFLFCQTILFGAHVKMNIYLENNDLSLKLTNTASATIILPNNTRGLPFITLVFDEELNIISDKDWAFWFDWVKRRNVGEQRIMALRWERFNYDVQPFGEKHFPLCLAWALPPFQPRFDLSKDGSYYVICVMRGTKENNSRTIQTSNLVEIEVKNKRITSFKEINQSAISSRLSSFINKELEKIKTESFSE